MTKIKPVNIAVSAATVLSAAAIAACGSSQPGTGSSGGSSGHVDSSASGSSSAPTVKAVAPSTKSLSNFTLTVGDQAGTGSEALLQAAGLDKFPFKVKWADFTSGPPILEAEASGSIDIGGVGDTPPVFEAAGGGQIAVVGALKDDPQSAALLVPKGSSIKSIKQLQGKSIAVTEGSSGDYHLLTVLEKAGISTKDVTIDNLQPAEGLSAFQSGKVDAWDVWAPYIQQAEKEYGAKALVTGAGYGSNYSYEVASKSALANPTAVAAIDDYLKTLYKARTWVNSHPQAWAKTWSASSGLPESVTLVAAKGDTQTPVAVNSTTVAAEQSLVKAFYSVGDIPKTFSFASFASSSFNHVL